MRILQLFVFIGVGSLLFACSPNERVILATFTSGTGIPSTVPATVTITQSLPTETHFPTLTPDPTATIAAPIPTTTSTPKPDFQLCSPLEEQTLQELQEIITGPYDPPPMGNDARHQGIDFSYYRRKDRTTVEGEIVQAILPGQVILTSGDQLPYGNMVIIETKYTELPEGIASKLEINPDESLYHLYAHLRIEPMVATRERVNCGQPLGEVGKTGYNIVNPHLHLEVRIGPAGATFMGGMRYYDTRASVIEQENYELWRTSGVFRHFDPMDLINAYLENRVGD
jgi:murein DD-endopeptidase MepM/ murein hydrolase activator NlpD